MVDQDGAKPRRRRRRSSEVDDQLAALLAKRDTLDADKAERDRIEKDALRKYAEVQVQLAGIDGEAQRKVEELQQQIAAVQQKARDDRAAGERAQAEALAALNGEPVGRTAEELAQLFELPIKRARRMIREGKSNQVPGSPAGSGPSARATKEITSGAAASSGEGGPMADSGTTSVTESVPSGPPSVAGGDAASD